MMFVHTDGEKVYSDGEVERTRYLWHVNNSVESVIEILREMSAGLQDPRVSVAEDEDPRGSGSDQFIIVSGKLIKPNTKEQNIEFRKRWDARYEEGQRRKRERSQGLR